MPTKPSTIEYIEDQLREVPGDTFLNLEARLPNIPRRHDPEKLKWCSPATFRKRSVAILAGKNWKDRTTLY